MARMAPSECFRRETGEALEGVEADEPELAGTLRVEGVEFGLSVN